MDLNICTVSLSTRDVTIEVRCRAHSLPHNPLVHIPIVTLNDLEIASFVFGSPKVTGKKSRYYRERGGLGSGICKVSALRGNIYTRESITNFPRGRVTLQMDLNICTISHRR